MSTFLSISSRVGLCVKVLSLDSKYLSFTETVSLCESCLTPDLGAPNQKKETGVLRRKTVKIEWLKWIMEGV